MDDTAQALFLKKLLSTEFTAIRGAIVDACLLAEREIRIHATSSNSTLELGVNTSCFIINRQTISLQYITNVLAIS